MKMYTVHYAKLKDPVDAGSPERALVLSAGFVARTYPGTDFGPALMVEQHSIFGGASRVVWTKGEDA